MAVRNIFIISILLINVYGRTSFDLKNSNEVQQGTERLVKQRLPRGLLTSAVSRVKFIGKLLKGLNRQRIHGDITINPDGSKTINWKKFLVGNKRNTLSVTRFKNEAKNKSLNGTVGAGLELENKRGHRLQLISSHDPEAGDLLTAAAKINLFHGLFHKLNVNAYITRNMSNSSGTPDHNTFAGGIEYIFGNKLGHTWEIATTPQLQQTDITSKVNLNLFTGLHTSLDLSSGVTKSVSPNETSSITTPGKLTLTLRW